MAETTRVRSRLNAPTARSTVKHGVSPNAGSAAVRDHPGAALRSHARRTQRAWYWDTYLVVVTREGSIPIGMTGPVG